MKNQIKTLLTIITVILGINSTSAQGNFQADGAGIGASPTLYGGSNSALYWDSNHATHSQLLMRNKSKAQLGRLYGVKNTNGTFFGLLDGDAQWSYLAKKDAYTQFRINNKGIITLDNTGINVEPRNTTTTGGRIFFKGAGSNNEWITDNYNGHFRIYHSGTVKFRVSSNGNVGIGDNVNPANKLDVDGTIRAKEVKVQSNWADYVFDEAYELPSLDAEKENIENKGHLLGFDSEADMAGEVQLGDVAIKQQVKIEEMMLHLIEMKEEIKQLQEDKASLSTELQLLKQ